MKITKEQLKDILIRTLKTVVVVALVAFVTAFTSPNMTDVEAALIAAGSAVGTFVLNIIVKLIKNLIDDWKLTPDELADIFGKDDEDADI
jgi:uncharacterized membrane protein